MVPQIYMKDPISGQILQPTNACQCKPPHLKYNQNINVKCSILQ